MLAEWEQKGQDIVAEMAIKYRKDVKEDSMEGTA